MQSNPVHVRIDKLVQDWNDTRSPEKVRIVRMLHRKSEEHMVDAFCTYLLSEDCDNLDIPILFESDLRSLGDFSVDLLRELHGMVAVWNLGKLPDGSQNDPIPWKPDFHLGGSDNPAETFVLNFNRLAEVLDLPTGVFLVGILSADSHYPKRLELWVEKALQAGLHEQIRLLILDTTERRKYDRLAAENQQEVAVLLPNLNMEGMMAQVAAMGDPTDPVVQYRKALVALSEAVGKRDKEGVSKSSKECLDIAFEQSEKDALWYGQVLVVYTILCNDQLGYKDWEKALDFATKGVSEMREAFTRFPEPFIGQKFLAQAVMTRGSVYVANSEWSNAATDYGEAADLYAKAFDQILTIEAFRMQGFCWRKAKRFQEALEALALGFEYGQTLSHELLPFTTFLGLVQLLLKARHEKLVPRKDVNAFMLKVFGEDWLNRVQNWNKAPDTETEPSPVPISIT